MNESHSARIVAIVNQKGGVGKSTTAVNLAAALALAGRRVLLADLDPQGHSTLGTGIDAFALPITIRDCLVDATRHPSTAVCVTSTPGLHVLPANILLSNVDRELPLVAQTTALTRCLDKLRGDYDYVLLDCPPALGLLTMNALVAAREVLVPIEPEFYALVGIQQILSSLELVRQSYGSAVEVTGVLLTRYDPRKALARESEKKIAGCFGPLVFATRIRPNVRLAEAPAAGQTIFQYAPSSHGADDYASLAREVISREKSALAQAA